MRPFAPSVMPSFGPSTLPVDRAKGPSIHVAGSLHVPFLFLASLLALLLIASRAPAQADMETCLTAHERAQVDRLQGRFLEARAGLAICAQRSCPRLVSKDCTTWLAELEAAQPTVVFTAVDEAGRTLTDVKVHARGALIAEQLDGKPIPLDPGPCAVRYEAEGRGPVQQQLTLHEGEKDRVVRAVLPTASASDAIAASVATPREAAASEPAVPDLDRRRTRWLRASYVLGGAAIAALAVSAGSGLRGNRMLQHCDDDGCSDPYRERGKTLFRTVNVSAITGGVLLASSLGALWVGLASRPESERAQRGVHVYADAQSARFALHTTW